MTYISYAANSQTSALNPYDFLMGLPREEFDWLRKKIASDGKQGYNDYPYRLPDNSLINIPIETFNRASIARSARRDLDGGEKINQSDFINQIRLRKNELFSL